MKAKTKRIQENRNPSPALRPATARRTDLPSPAELPRAGGLKLLALSGILVACTIFLYARVGSHPFINYDDQDYVVQNSHVQQGLTWNTFTWALTATEAANWHPLTWISHALDCQLFGLNASGHHWTSVAIHALNVLLLFLLLQRATGAVWRSFFVAGLFAFHPLNVESVAWIAERKNVLSTLLFLLAVGAYGWYARKPGVPRYLVVTLLFVLGLAAKPMVITLPFVFLLLDFWPLGRIINWTEPSRAFPVPQESFRKLVLEKLPLLLFSAASAAITVAAQGTTVVSTVVLPIGVRLENAIYAYGMYLWKAIWPAKLALIYPHPGRTLAAWQPALAALLLLAMGALAWRRRRTRPQILFGLLWFLGTAVPVIGIIQVGLQVIADRYAYVPLIGIFVIVAWAAGDLADLIALPVVLRAAAMALVLALLSWQTWRQIGYWDNTIDLWTHALSVTTNNSIAEQNLANALFALGRYPQGMVHYRNYSRLEPMDPMAHARVGADFQDHGQLAEARHEFEAAIRSERMIREQGLPAVDPPAMAVTYANLGVVYAELGEEQKARESARSALETNAGAVEGMMNQLAQAVGARPSAQGYLRLGILLNLTGHSLQATQAFAAAQKLDPTVKLPPIESDEQR